MDINGIQKLTLLDYPGQCACTVFLAGCNLRCPFCHNASLVLGGAPTAMTEGEFLAFLKKRKGLLDGVCVTGGEPTLRPDLPDFIRKIKAMGYLVKLDTNGSNPKMLRRLIDEKQIDYVAMDIKSSPERYAQTCGGIDILSALEESLAILKENNVEYELRTTLCKPFHDEKALEAMGKWLSGTKNYYLQNFVDSGDLIGSEVSGFTKEEMEALHKCVLPHIPTTRIRGI
jgi:pyruvate formate lyase activating enzyme